MRQFRKYPSNIKASSNYKLPDKKLVFPDGDSYEFRYTSEEGDVFEPKSGSGNWWTSYIVTPDNKLLSWEFSGRYTPVDAVYGEDFWVEDNSVEACTSITSSTSISIREIAEGIHSYFEETGAETANNTKILEYLTSKGYDVSDVTNSEINEAWDLQASWWDGEDEEDVGPVVLSDGIEISDKEQAYIWLQENTEQYGNTYFWDSSLRADLDRLIERFGNTYFWRS